MSETPLVGREFELGVLGAALERLRRGRGSWVAVTGDAGIGKTRLLQEMVARASGELVLTARGTEFEQQIPFALMIEALDGHLAQAGPGRIATMLDGQSAELATVFPSLAALRPSSGSAPARHRCRLAIRALLDQLAAARPLVLVLDDVQWADEASVELLATLLERELRQPVLVLLAYRRRGIPQLLRSSVASAASDGRGEVLRLAPLRMDQANALLGDVDPALRPLLYRESGGNPFYLSQLARAPVHDMARRAALLGEEPDDAEPAVPAAVRASLDHELGRVSRAGRDLARAAAVLGEPFVPQLAMTVGELDGPEASAALAELRATGLVRSAASSDSFAFRHPIVRRAIYESSGQGWLLAAHERAAAALTARQAPALVIAPHVERSARPDDADAIELLAQAGRAAAGHAPRTAARCYGAALRLATPGAIAPERRFELMMLLTASLVTAGHLDEGSEVLHDMLAQLPREDAERRVGVVTMLTQMVGSTGRPADALKLLESTLDDAPDQRQRAPLNLIMAVQHLTAGDLDEAAHWGVQAIAGAQRAGNAAVEAAAAAIMSQIDHGRGSMLSARQRMQHADAVMGRVGDTELANPLPPLLYVIHAHVEHGDFEWALLHGERGLTDARATGRAVLVVNLMFAVGMSQLGLGRLEAAVRTAEELLEAARLLGIEQIIGWAWTLSARVAVQRGEIADATTAAERAVECAVTLPRTWLAQLAYRTLADVRIASGRPASARDALLEQSGGRELSLVDPGARALVCDQLVEAAVALDDVADARAWAQAAEASIDESFLPTQRAAAHRARAMASLADVDAGAAAEHARAAAAAFAERNMRVEAARARTLVGRALAAAGETADAIAVLESAHRELEACGAHRARAEAARELRRLARPVASRQRRGQAGEGVAALSGREREVADLITRGYTNKRIAATLFLSARTIESHVAHIFRKLGVSSRTEIAREIGNATRQ